MTPRNSLFTAMATVIVAGASVTGCGGSSPAASSTVAPTVPTTVNTAEASDKAGSAMSSTAPAMSTTDSATTDVEVGSFTGSDVPTEPQPDASPELKAEMDAIDQIGICDGNWSSVLETSNQNRPDGVTELKEAWTCTTDAYVTDILRWADDAEVASNLKALNAFMTQQGINDPATLSLVIKGDHIISSADSSGDQSVDAQTQIATAVDGKIVTLADYAS